MIKLLKAKASDRSFAFDVRKTCLVKLENQDEVWQEERERLLHHRRFLQYQFLIIWYDNTRVGIIAYGLDRQSLDLKQLYILPQYQSLGIGTICLKMLIRYASELKLGIVLKVMRSNLKAIKFYQSMGFIIVDQNASHFMFNLMHDFMHNFMKDSTR